MSEHERKLYVANLPLDVVEDEVRKVFGIYGDVEEVHLIAAKGQGRSDRSAFVRFSSSDEATAAMAILSDMYKFREADKAIRCRVAHPVDGKGGHDGHAGSAVPPPMVPPGGLPPPPAPGAANGGYLGREGRDPGGKLWIGNLPHDISDSEMRKMFSVHGHLEEVNILPAKSRSGQLCAFVHYSTTAEADSCLAAMGSGIIIREGGEELKVERPGNRKGFEKGEKGFGKGDGWAKGDGWGKGGDNWGKGGGDWSKGGGDNWSKGGGDNWSKGGGDSWQKGGGDNWQKGGGGGDYGGKGGKGGNWGGKGHTPY